MAKAQTIESLLQAGSTEWNKLRKSGRVPLDHTGATFAQLFSANADLSGLGLIGTEWDKCDLSKINFRETDLSNAYFHGGRLQDCDFRGANLDGCTFERVKLLRCDFSGAKGLEELELDDVDMDRVVGLGGEDAPPPPPPPVQGTTSFTREQRAQAAAAQAEQAVLDLPPFRPQDPPGVLLARALKVLGNIPAWVLDASGVKPPVPPSLSPGQNLETVFREAVRARLEGRKPTPDPGAVERAHKALRMGAKDAGHAAMYLKEMGVEPAFRFSAAKTLKASVKAETDIDDLTGPVDPRTTGALLFLRLPEGVAELAPEVRRRASATQLFAALLEAGFSPENNWEEALEASPQGLELAEAAAGQDREALAEAFRTFTGLPEEARLRRLVYLAEAAYHLEQVRRLPEGTEPHWLQEPEARECHDREMNFVQALSADEIPTKVAELAQAELGVPVGSVPEDSAEDLYLHFRCPVCGKEKLFLQTP
jgi:hypothetical protein